MHSAATPASTSIHTGLARLSVILDHPAVAYFECRCTQSYVTNGSSITLSIKNSERTAINRQQLRTAQPTNSSFNLFGYNLMFSEQFSEHANHSRCDTVLLGE
jgi:hypothetical protein